MRGLRHLAALLILLISPLHARQAVVPDAALSGIDRAYNMHFISALGEFDRLIAQQPKNPYGHLLKTVCHYYYYLVDMNDGVREEKFRKLADATIALAERQARQEPDNLNALFCLGTAYMYLAAYYGEGGSWLRAFWYGRQGVNVLKSVVERDPEFYDAYLGLGLYHYYAAVMPKLVKAVSSLFGVEADRLRGLAELKLARERGRLTRVESTFFLGYVYLYMEKEHAKAAPLLRELTAQYPENPIFQIILGDAYRKAGAHDAAIATYERSVTDRINTRFPQLVSTSYYLMGNIHFERNAYRDAIHSYARAVEGAAAHRKHKEGIYAWGLVKQGEAWEMLGDRERARSYYTMVQKRDNKHAWEAARKRLGRPLREIDKSLTRARNYILTRKYDDALQTYSELLAKLQPGSRDYPSSALPEIRYNMGRILLEQKDYQNAITEFKRVLAVKRIPKSWIRPWTHYQLGSCYRNIGDLGNALAEFKRAYRYDDGNLRLEIDKMHQELGSAYFSGGR